MNKKFIALTAILMVMFFSCSKDDNDVVTTPPRNFAAQYATDIANIETFMKTHYMVVTQNPGAVEDMNVEYYPLPSDGSKTSIWDQTEYPKQFREIEKEYEENGVPYTVKYKIYYIQFRQGSGVTSKSPCNVDYVLTSYRGKFIEAVEGTTTGEVTAEEFEEVIRPESYLDLTKVIQGWSEIFPLFKTGSYTAEESGTISYTDFGAGVMFIPSGLAYYNGSSGTIPSYSPLIFSIKLYEIHRADQDNDGIPSFQEDLNNDGYMYKMDNEDTNPDDTDGDDTPDYLDVDDDGDYFMTSYEIEKDHTTKEKYPFDEIPACEGGNGKKRHLDPSCH